MRVLVMGASGGTGRELVLQGLACGYRVRAWALHPAELTLQHDRLQYMHGDARDRQRLRAAIQGVDAVVCALGSTSGLTPTDLCGTVAERLVEAMQQQGLQRIVCVTSMGTTDALGPMHTRILDPLLLHPIYDDKRRQERILTQSGLAWTIVRPGRLLNGAPTFRAKASVGRSVPGLAVRRSDLAAFLLEELESCKFEHQAPYLAEPVSLRLHRWLVLGESWSMRAKRPRAASSGWI